MLRKIVLTGAVLIVPERNEQARVLVALLLSVSFLTLQLIIKPLRRAEDDVFVKLVHLTLVLLYLTVLVLKSCDLSRTSCEAFGFGVTGEGAPLHDRYMTVTWPLDSE